MREKNKVALAVELSIRSMSFIIQSTVGIICVDFIKLVYRHWVIPGQLSSCMDS